MGKRKVIYPEKKTWYRCWRMKKRSGGYRTIEAPNDDLKAKQRKLYKQLICTYKASSIANCGVKKRNTVRAAKQIIGLKYKWKTDIHDFFGSITGDMIEKALLENKKVSPKLARAVRYACTNKYDVLPQGAPTSPFLANVACAKMFNFMAKAVHLVKGKVTSYADDIIVSAPDAQHLAKAKHIVYKLLRENGLFINKEKSKFLRRKQVALGICVAEGADHPRLPRKDRYNLRAWLHNVEKALLEGKMVKESDLNQLYGHVAYADMVGDQFAGRFNAKVMRIRELAKNRTKKPRIKIIKKKEAENAEVQ